MAKVLVTEAYLQAIADAIRTKNGKSVRYRPGDMATAILALEAGGAGQRRRQRRRRRRRAGAMRLPERRRSAASRCGRKRTALFRGIRQGRS